MRWWLGAAALACFGATAQAQAPEEGSGDAARALTLAQTQMANAEFVRALESYNLALRAPSLTRSQLVSALSGRALARQVSGDTEAAERDLATLLSLDRQIELAPEAPPSLRRTFARVRQEFIEPLSLEVSSSRQSESVVVQARVSGDVGSLVAGVRVHYQVDDGAWREGEPGLRVSPDEGVRFYAEAVGPGGVVLVTDGSRASPREIRLRLPSVSDDPNPNPNGGQDDPWPLILGVGIPTVLLLAAGAIVLGFVLSEEPRTVVNPPREMP